VPIYVTFGLSDRPELMDAIALPLALGCATASYYLVERPFLRRRAVSRRVATSDRKTTLSPALAEA
jgi:peptidoglycan/LPS O-acetylase OafA/YrhL